MQDRDDDRLPDPMLVGIDEEEELDDTVLGVVSAPTELVKQDGPMGRVTIDMMELNDLDQLLASLRARRLARVDSLRTLAQARQHATEEAELAKFEKLVSRVRKTLDKMEADEERVTMELNKLRIMATVLGG